MKKSTLSVSAIGLGAMPLSLKGRPSEPQAIQVIHRALELGVTLIDTADAYCVDESDKHHNERLIAKALETVNRGWSEGNFLDRCQTQTKSFPKGQDPRFQMSSLVIATKGGLMRPKGDWVCNGDPKHLLKTIRESFEALGGEKPVPLWQFHAPDPDWPIEKSLQAAKEALKEGWIERVGVSNFSVEEIERARSVVEIVSVQNEYNLWCRAPERNGVLDYCEKEGLLFLPWSPLGGASRVKLLGKIPALVRLAEEKRASPCQIVLASLRAKSPSMVPIPGASRVASIEDSVGSLHVKLSPDERKRVDNLVL